MTWEKGDSVSVTETIDKARVAAFAGFSGDDNPIHVDPKIARLYGHARPIAHGAILVSVLSRVIGTQLPGYGAIWMSQDIDWQYPVYVGDTVTMVVTVSNFSKAASLLSLDVNATNQDGVCVMKGASAVRISKPMSDPGNRQMETGKDILVTGGSRGIGSVVAERLAEAGYSPHILYRRDEAMATELVERIQSRGNTAAMIRQDLAAPAAELRSTLERHGVEFSGVVHCASAPVRSEEVDEISADEFQLHQQVSCHAAVTLVSTLAPFMKNRGFGRFVFMGTSALNQSPPKGWSAYLAAKHALWGLTRNVATELGPFGITANMISPSLIVTDLTSGIPLRAKEVEARKNPIRRLAEPEDVANTVKYLLDPAASFVNGQNLMLNGGS